MSEQINDNTVEQQYTEGELILNSFKALHGEMSAIESLLELVSKNNQVEGNILLTDPREYTYNSKTIVPSIINSEGIIEAVITFDDDDTYVLQLTKDSIIEDVVDALLDNV